jgi:hypothetical protein
MSISLDPTLRNLNDCGCCAGVTVETPVEVTNLPGLATIAYRVGTHALFKQSLLARLSGFDLPALRGLKTRNDDDFSIALLDAWATVADVLTFYQERIANECYLRTATERFSLLQLARLIGYELRPGVAASTYLAFTLEDTPAPGVPNQTTIDIGTKVQSIPGPNEQPQTFETIEKIDARAEWNGLKPKTKELKLPATGDQQVYLKGVSTNLKVGDGVVFVGGERVGTPTSEQWDFRIIESVTVDQAGGTTRLTWSKPLESNFNDTTNAPKVYALRQRAALFGANAPDWRTMPDSVKKQYSQHSAQGLFGAYYSDKELSTFVTSQIDSNIDFAWGGSSPATGVAGTNLSVRWTGSILAPITGTYTFETHSDDGVNVWIDSRRVISSWKDQDGSTAVSGTIYLEAGKYYDLIVEYYQAEGGSQLKLQWVVPGSTALVDVPAVNLFHDELLDQWPDFNIAYGSSVPISLNTIYLDAIYPKIVPGTESWLVLTTPTYVELYQVASAHDDARSDFTLSSKSTRLDLTGDKVNLAQQFGTHLRDTVVFGQSELLDYAEVALSNPIQGSSIDLAEPANGIETGHRIIVSGKKPLAAPDAPPISESVVIEQLSDDGLTITLRSGLVNQYDPATVTLYGNVAAATHGETKQDVLGSGDASQTFQHFTLKQSPLTYVASTAPSGADSTLQVRVNDLLWHEMPAFYGHGPRERNFVTRIGDDGTTTVEFGDGQTGARLPTGRENVNAYYRKGIGTAGNVKAGQLNLLMTRLLGVKSVINPVPAAGAADRESLDDARSNAPLTVLTLDRIVSLQDYEDFARAFSGVAKALATWTWTGEVRGVFVTVAGPDGALIPDGSATHDNLVNALKASGDPHIPLRVQTFNPAVVFKMGAAVQINPDYDPAKVLAHVEEALRLAFSFNARAFGQAVTLSEVMAIIQGVDGVVAADVTKLYRSDDPAGPGINDILLAAAPQAGAGTQSATISAAELLTLSAGALDELGTMT